MRSSRVFSAVDTHTEGMPTRVITAGFGTLPGRTMLERSQHVATELDGWRRLLMYEPRGHQAMSGAILQPPIREDADLGVVYIEVAGCLPMCGHGTIGVVTAAIETGLVTVTEPVTTLRLDTPAGLVTVQACVVDGECRSVTLTNVPSFRLLHQSPIEVPNLGTLTVDVAYGGNFYVIIPADSLGLPITPASADLLIQRGIAVLGSANAQLAMVHPTEPSIRGSHHVLVTTPPLATPEGLTAMGTVVINPGYLDRSPCGTGTSALMACMHADGDLDLRRPLVHSSIIGSQFTGHVVQTTEVGGVPAVVPTITGRAWVTALSQYLLDPADPYPEGFLI